MYWILHLLACFTFSQALGIGIPSFLDIGGLHSHLEASKQVSMPNPYELNAQWWHYFDADGQELSARTAKTTSHLLNLYSKLSFEDQQAASPLINSISASLEALPEAKIAKAKDATLPKSYNKTYTLDQQLQLNQQKRKHLLEIKKEQIELEELKNRIAKVHNHIDTLLAAYLNEDSKPTTERLLKGLEIMAQRAAIGIAEENRRLIESEIENQQGALNFLEKELEVARNAFDASSFDENQLEQDIQQAQSNFDKIQAERSRNEALAIGVRISGPHERASKKLRAQKEIQNSVEEALAWTNLAFQTLRYNLIMHTNNRFNLNSQDMREKLRLWKEHLHKVLEQQIEWEKLTLREQDRLRRDQAVLIAKNESVDPTLSRINEARHASTSKTLSMLQHFQEDIASVQWLIDQLEHSNRAFSNFIERWWGDFIDYISSLWTGLVKKLSTSLFKIDDIPITFLTLFKVIFIAALSYCLSYLVRRVIEVESKRRSPSSESAYYMGRLAHYFVLFIGALAILFSIGLEVSHVMILLGALTFGIGFGFQSVATNFFCGLRILFERKIKIGDYIELPSGRYGKVTEIHVQNTVIYTSDGIEIVIPNSELLSSPLVNWTMKNDHRRLHIPFSISYDNDKELVRKVISESAQSVPCTIRREYGDPQVWLVKFGDHSLDFELVVWVNYKSKSFTDSKEADYLWAIETALRENKIELPIQQHFTYVKQVPSDPLPTASPYSAHSLSSLTKSS